MAPTAAAGVVDHKGEAFGHKNLFVADGAIVPKAIGLNPSGTIGALAERIAAGMLPRGPRGGAPSVFAVLPPNPRRRGPPPRPVTPYPHDPPPPPPANPTPPPPP